MREIGSCFYESKTATNLWLTFASGLVFTVGKMPMTSIKHDVREIQIPVEFHPLREFAGIHELIDFGRLETKFVYLSVWLRSWHVCKRAVQAAAEGAAT